VGLITSVALRYLFLIIFYVFILYLIKIIFRDIRQQQELPEPEEQCRGQLKVVQAEEQYFEPGECFVFTDILCIGRDNSNDIHINKDVVSKKHARITLHKNRYWLEDLKSLNGTKLNNKPLKKPAALSEGDEINVGGVTFKFERCTYEVE
jgi:hypothetical protein